MAVISGKYCSRVEQRCLEWLDDPKLSYARCAVYAQPSRCVGARIDMQYCVDRYEYTRPGEQYPLNHQSLEKVETLCRTLGKRLCTEAEWNFACEGEEMWPYPYGFARAAVCNQDRSDLFERTRWLLRMRDLREAADGRPLCVSVFGVFNLVGNLDEPVLNELAGRESRFRGVLKGGWWAPGRNRCRAATTAHDNFLRRRSSRRALLR